MKNLQFIHQPEKDIPTLQGTVLICGYKISERSEYSNASQICNVVGGGKCFLVPESPMQQRGGSPRSSFHHRSCIVVFSWSEVGSLAIEENGSCCGNVIHVCRYTFCPQGPMNFRPNRIEKKSIWILSFFCYFRHERP